MEFSTSKWASHRKGEQTRQKIVEAINGKKLESIPEIATYIGRCERQTRRQIKVLIREGQLLRVEGKLIFNPKNTYMAS